MNAAPQNIQFVCEGLDHPEGVAFEAEVEPLPLNYPEF